MGWQPSHDAPRDRPVWLYLPASAFKRTDSGTVIEVSNEIVVAHWDKKHGTWLATDRFERAVYPSLWHDASVDGPPPAAPELT